MKGILIAASLIAICQSCAWVLMHPEVILEAEEVIEEVVEDVEELKQPKKDK